MPSDLLQRATASIHGLSDFVDAGVYHSVSHGDITLSPENGFGVHLAKSVRVQDENGGFSQVPLATFPSGIVPEVHTGDSLTIGVERWRVEDILEDDGYVLRLVLRNRP